MQLTPETLSGFQTGKFEDFLDDGAMQLRKAFPDRFIDFDDDDALDAGRNSVGLSFEKACELGRRSGLLAMRIAYLRAAFGIGVLEDPRYPLVREMVVAQAGAAAIKPNTSIGTHLSKMRPYWEKPSFLRDGTTLPDFIEKMGGADQDWEVILTYLKTQHDDIGTGTTDAGMRLFVNQAFKDATAFGMDSLYRVQLHVLMADALGIHFFDDPLLPHWGEMYRDGNLKRIEVALHDALLNKDR